MKMQMVAIKDRALNAFMTPFFTQTVNQAIRMFQDEINRKESPMHAHPDDYDLWHLGEWNDDTGLLVVDPDDRVELPKQLAIGKNLINT